MLCRIKTLGSTAASYVVIWRDESQDAELLLMIFVHASQTCLMSTTMALLRLVQCPHRCACAQCVAFCAQPAIQAHAVVACRWKQHITLLLACFCMSSYMAERGVTCFIGRLHRRHCTNILVDMPGTLCHGLIKMDVLGSL